MSNDFTERLNKILPRLISDDFLSGKGLGNEIAFYIFDYPPESELKMREHVDFIIKQIPKQKPELRVGHIKLFDLVIEYLQARNLLDPALKMQRTKGDEAVLKALAAPLKSESLAPVFVDSLGGEPMDLVMVTGVGSVYPMVRSHGLLNNLHSRLGRTPLVMFYPGQYDGQSLKLFGCLKDKNYYRAFKLVP